MTIKRTSTSPPAPMRRRDGVGHLDPVYADELRELGRKRAAPDGRAFINDSYTDDAFAEQLGEQAVETATSGEDHALGGRDDDNAPEETLSPFSAANVSAEDADADEDE
jgi:hypothetical protein